MPALAVDPDPRELAQLADNTPPPKTVAPPAPSLADIEKRVRQGQIGAFDQTIAAQGDEAKALQEKQTAQAPFEQDLQDTIKQSQTHLGQVPKPPAQMPVPGRENYIDKEVAKGLAVVAMLTMGMSMFGARSRGQLAMAGLTGAMQGFHEGNEEKYKSGMEQYKEQIKEQQLQFENQMAEHDAILRDDKLNLSQKMQALELAGIKGDNKILQAAANRKDMAAITKVGEETLKGIAAMQGAQNRADQLSETARHNKFEEGHQNAALAEQQRYHDLQVSKQGRADDTKLGPTGQYYDKDARDFVPQIPTRGDLRENPGRYVRLTPPQAQLVPMIKDARRYLNEAEEAAESALHRGSGASDVIGAAGAFARDKGSFLAGQSAMAKYKTARQAIITQAAAAETVRGNLTAYLRKALEVEVPAPEANLENARTQFAEIRNIYDTRLRTLVGDEAIEEINRTYPPAKAIRTDKKTPDGRPLYRLEQKDKDGKPLYWHRE